MFTQILFGVGIIVPVVSIYYLQRRYVLKLKQFKKVISDNYYHCIFITMDNFNCRRHIIEKSPCTEICSLHHLETILAFIRSARKAISMCMYFSTLEQVTNELIKARKRGVNVRIITDPTMFKMKCPFYALKYQHDFQVKMSCEKDALMHHKFVLIDENDTQLAKLMMGSLNLTIQGLTQNFDFVMFTNDKAIIGRYSQEFEILWKHCVNDIYVAELLNQK